MTKTTDCELAKVLGADAAVNQQLNVGRRYAVNADFSTPA